MKEATWMSACELGAQIHIIIRGKLQLTEFRERFNRHNGVGEIHFPKLRSLLTFETPQDM